MPIELPAKIAFLKKIHLFHGLGEDELAAVAAELQEVSYAKDAVIFQQGGKADSFYLIYGGIVRIVRTQNKKEYQLARLIREDYFGEMALVANRPRSATATALTDTSMLVLSRADFQRLFKEHPQLELNLSVAIHSRQLAQRLRFKWLRSDEVIYFLARKHRVILLQNLGLPVFLLLIPLFLFYAWFTFVPSLVVVIAAVVSLLALGAWIAWLIVDWGNDYYIVTNQRVVWLEKVVGIYDSRQESALSTVLSVGVEANPLGRVLDYGNVIVRTFVGRIPFSHVEHPNQAARMIEEYWMRTRSAAVAMEKEAMKDEIRKKLGIPIPPKPKTDSATPPPAPPPRRASLLRLLGANTLKLRLESGDTVIYRKHWVVLILEAWMPVLGILATLTLFIQRLWQLAFSPTEAFISFSGGLTIDVWASVLLIVLLVFVGWFIYRVMDWSNDQFIVNAEQIIDLDREPFGTETRNAAQLENILGTEYQRIGILGNIFNFGTVYITVGGTKLAFENVMDPAAVQSDINRRFAARKARNEQQQIAKERERMAEWLATYHLNSEALRAEEERKQNQKPE
ncbi:MAG TPA: cyclic nucleotide-binding domain-containing protein [Anaerolineales bacterium]|nr:cyclic nucleotide-binding domain-containing protein [Anaerolineales bacterium]